MEIKQGTVMVAGEGDSNDSNRLNCRPRLLESSVLRTPIFFTCLNNCTQKSESAVSSSCEQEYDGHGVGRTSSPSAVKGVPKVCSKIRSAESKVAKEGAQVTSLVKPETSTREYVASSDDDGYIKAEEGLAASNIGCVHDVSEATGQPAGLQPDLASQVNSRRHGTRNRPPTAKALEAVASGFLVLGGKRKGEPKNPGTSRPPQKAHKSSVCTPTSSDTDKSSMEVDLQR